MSDRVREMLLNLSQDATCMKYVFENFRTGSHILDIKRGFTSAVADAGIVNLTFHDLRHTWSQAACHIHVTASRKQRFLRESRPREMRL